MIAELRLYKKKKKKEEKKFNQYIKSLPILHRLPIICTHKDGVYFKYQVRYTIDDDLIMLYMSR